MKPHVSVIIPYYNTAGLVAETLDSVLDQTYRNFEVILVNDDSPDTPELERVLQPYLGRITYVRKEKGGVSSARNRGIGMARGEFVALIDSDDLWMPHYLEFQLARLEADPSADVVYPNAVIFGAGETGRRLAMPMSAPMPEVTFTRLVTEECSVVVSVTARKAALERAGLFDEQLSRCEDFDLWLRCLKAGSRIIYHHTVLLRYRRRPGSLSSDPARMAAHAARVLRKMQATVELTDEERAAIVRKLDWFDGQHLFYEGKQAFFAGDCPTAVDRMDAARKLLRSPRIGLLTLLLRTAPGLAKKAYAWRHRSVPNS